MTPITAGGMDDIIAANLPINDSKNPLTEIKPNKSNEMPPITAGRMDDIIAANLPTNDRTIAITAAKPIIQVEYTLVIANTPIFSPYVVFGVEPNKLESIVETPFPASDRSRPGSLVKSLLTIPINIGIIFKKPLNVTQQIIVIKSVAKATSATVKSIDQFSTASSGGIQPAISAATGTNSRPITATIAPIAAGGNRTSIQAVPTNLIITATKHKTIPTAKNPPKT